MSTPNLNLDHIAGSQNNKETTANATFDGLDNAMNAVLDKASTGVDITLTDLEFRSANVIRITGTTGTDISLFIPAAIARKFTVINNTDASVFVEAEAASPLAITLGASSISTYYTDGVSGFDEVSAGGGSTSMDIGMFIQGVPLTEELVFRYIVVSPFRIPASATGSHATAGTTSTGVMSFTMKKNGTPFGSVVFDGSAAGTFSVVSATDFAAGDVFQLVSDEDADTLADVSITFKGTRL